MLLNATPEQKVMGVPPMVVLERSGQLSGLKGLREPDGLGQLNLSLLTDIIKPAAETGLNILGSRYAVPQLQRGTSIQTTAAGDTLLLAQPEGMRVEQPYPISTLTRFDTNLGTGVLVAGAVVVALILFMFKGKGK